MAVRRVKQRSREWSEPAGRAGAWPAAALHRLMAFYFAASGLALLFPGRPGYWPVLALAHGAGAALAWRASAFADDVAAGAPLRFAAVLAAGYPLLLLPFLYSELAVLNQSVHGGAYFDDLVIRWEAALFGGEPSRTLAAALPYRWLSEALHASYLSYYAIIYGPGLWLLVRRRFPAFAATVFTLMLVFTAHYLFFTYFPVQGPRYLYATPVPTAAQGPLHDLTHRILEQGSSQGAAFPSSHAAVAAAQVVAAARYAPRLVLPVAVLTVGLSLGAVYGGFHYATDMAAGLVLGLLLAWIAPAVARWLGSSRGLGRRVRPPPAGMLEAAARAGPPVRGGSHGGV